MVKQALIGALVAFALGGCVMEGAPEAVDHDDSSPYDDDAIDVNAQAIRGGNLASSGKRGVVEVNDCTGVLISRNHLITAAHCVAPLLNGAEEGYFYGYVHYFKWSSHDPILLHDHGAPMYAWILPSYQEGGDLDYASDLALVQSNPKGHGWPYVGAGDILPISQGTCAQIDRMEFYGQGYNSSAGSGNGVLRWYPVDLYGCHKHYFYDLAGGSQVCKGDSGGPHLVNIGNGTLAVAGLLSGADRGERNCTYGGGEQWSTRLNEKVSWIESKIGRTCTKSSATGHTIAICGT